MEMNREHVIIRTSIIGIAVNIFLAAFKAAIGLVTGSIAVLLDAVNNTGNTEAARLQNDISHLVLAHDWVLQLHGFYLEESEKKIRFDVVIDFSMDAAQGLEILYRELQEKFPWYTFEIVSDVDVSVTETE